MSVNRILKLLPVVLSICTSLLAQNPEPIGWYAGDMHAHRSCGGPPVSVTSLSSKMSTQNLATLSVLADMGNGNVQDPSTDLLLVNGQDAPISTPGRIVHWDAEWHWDPTFTLAPHQALGGHVVALGLKEAHQIWDESTSSIFTWAHQQNAIAGFAHLQSLDAGFPQTLSCCKPLDYPVEVALGAADFVSEDVDGGDSAIAAYYRLLNSGFRPGFAAGTDYPCNDGLTIGSPLTYVRVANGDMTYRNWIEGIANGRTVVSRNGHNEFLDLQVNGSAGPGDEIFLTGGGTVQVTVQWSAAQDLTGTIELVSNGVVVASTQASVTAGSSAALTASVNFTKSGWLAARRMGPNGHMVHTAATFVTVDNAPVRANADDPQFYVQWMDSLLTNTALGGPWNGYFPTELAAAQARYQAAKSLYQRIAQEAQGTSPALSLITVTPANPTLPTGATQQFAAAGNYSDASSLNITGQVVWSSSNPSVVRINGRGLAVAANTGTTVITATQAGISGSTTISVETPAPPVISNVIVSNVTTTSATVSWTTNVAADSQVVYGTTAAYGSASARDSTAATAHSITLAGLSANITYHFAVKSQGAFGNLATSPDATFATVIFGGPVSLSLWPPTAAPNLADGGPDSPVNLGVRFHSDIAGTITGIRFYKSPGNTGPHFGYLWTASGTLLASVAFTNETAGGWQHADFAAPVAIMANTDYVAAYFCPSGHYSADPNYFSAAHDAAPLHAPGGTDTAPNGRFAYGAPGLFPDRAHTDTNYWVDLALVVSADAIPPSVVSVTPAPGSSAVSITDFVTASFARPLDPSTLTSDTFLLRDGANNVVPASIVWDSANNVARLQPSTALSYSTGYTAVLKGGVSDPRVKDLNGNVLASDFLWSFTTKNPPPPPPTRATTPILVLTSAANGFSGYYAEILRNEGFTEFATADLGQLSAALLADYDVVLLPQMSLTVGQVSTLQTWVSGGGNLIAMRPDKQLAGMLGIADAGTTLSDAYMAISTASGPGAGITGESLQFHDAADLYTLSGATRIATLYSNSTTALSNPAVGLNNFGDGQAAFFAYDLARSVVFTRQGNPAWSGQERDGVAPIRPNDLFFGGTAPDYLDLSKVAIPQADEQQRLLANMILTMNLTRRPLPRLWYLPRGLKAAVVMTGDDHGNGGTAGRWDQYIAASPANCSVDNWECVRSTSYVYSDVPMSRQKAQQYSSQGFELALHLLTECVDLTPGLLQSSFTNQLAAFATTWPAMPAPQTSRTHCVLWNDYDTVPQVELAHGIRFDSNYYYWPGTWILGRPGFMNGSGLPMRFATRNGALVDVYQAATQMTDESGQSYPFTIDTLLDNALGPLGYYGVFTANMHTDSVDSAGSEAIVASAQARGVPIVSAQQMLTWLDGRNSSTISAVSWDGINLVFQLQVAPGANGLEVMIPVSVGQAPLTRVLFNGSPVPFPRHWIKGIQYAFVGGATGTYRVSYGEPTAILTVTAQNASKIYGDANPQFTVGVSGFVNNDPSTVVTGAPDCSSAAAVNTPVGTSPITCSLGSLDAINYTFKFVPAALTINPAPVVLAGNNVSRLYGDPNPALTGTVVGLKAGDQAGATFSTSAVATSLVGNYPIAGVVVPGTGFSANNYTFTSSGILTVARAPLNAVAVNVSRVYGDPNPGFTGALLGLKNGDAITATFNTAADATSAVSNYAILPTFTDPQNKLLNYTVVPSGALTITPAPLTVTAANASRPYGALNPAFTGAITGIKNGDNITATFASAANTASAVGSYPIAPALADPASKLGNYAVTSTNGVLTVTQATPSVTLNVQAAQPNSQMTAQIQNTGPALPTGTVQFFDGTTPVGAPVAIAPSGGVAQATLQVHLTEGAHSITAGYLGDGTYTASTSAAAAVTVPVPQFIMNGNGGNTSATVAAGKDAVFNITLAPQGFAGTITFTCSGAPVGTTCAVNPNPVTIAGTAVATSVPLSVTISNTQSASLKPVVFRSAWFVFAGVLMGLASGFNKKRRKLAVISMTMFLIVGLVACGGSSSSGPGPVTRGPTNAVITVAGASGSQSTSINLNLTITH
ncbi:MAG TPA: MBG domain-containing protein [Candidatus Angelobacter sp.]